MKFKIELTKEEANAISQALVLAAEKGGVEACRVAVFFTDKCNEELKVKEKSKK